MVESYLKGNVSYSELGLKYGILNHRVIGSWIKKYKQDGPKTYDAPTVREEELQEVVVKAMNEVIKTSEETSALLIKNTEEVIAGSNLKEIEVINKEATAKQKKLRAQVRAKKDHTEIADEVDELKSEKHDMLVKKDLDEDKKRRIRNMGSFLEVKEWKLQNMMKNL